MPAVSYRLLRLSSAESDFRTEYFKTFAPNMSPVFTEDSAEAYVFPSFPDFVHAVTVLWLSLGPMDLSFEPVYVIA